MRRFLVLISAAILACTSAVSANIQAEVKSTAEAVATRSKTVPHPGKLVARPSRRAVSAGIQHGIRREQMHRADLVNQQTRNYDYAGYQYPRRHAHAYARPIRRFANHGYRSQRSYRHYRSYNRSYYRSYRDGYRRHY